MKMAAVTTSSRKVVGSEGKHPLVKSKGNEDGCHY